MMSPKEYAELLDYVNDKHGWDNMYDNVEAGRKFIKYIDCTCDTRDSKIWIITITFREIGNSPLPNDKKYDKITYV